MGRTFIEKVSHRIDLTKTTVEGGGPFASRTASFTYSLSLAAAFGRNLPESISHAITITDTELWAWAMAHSITVSDVIVEQKHTIFTNDISISDAIVTLALYGRSLSDSITFTDYFRGVILQGGVVTAAQGSKAQASYTPGPTQATDTLQY